MKVQAFIDEVATPRLTRFVWGPSIVTTIEVDVPPLAADAGSVAETLALRLTRSNNAIADSASSSLTGPSSRVVEGRPPSNERRTPGSRRARRITIAAQ